MRHVLFFFKGLSLAITLQHLAICWPNSYVASALGPSSRSCLTFFLFVDSPYPSNILTIVERRHSSAMSSVDRRGAVFDTVSSMALFKQDRRYFKNVNSKPTQEFTVIYQVYVLKLNLC